MHNAYLHDDGHIREYVHSAAEAPLSIVSADEQNSKLVEHSRNGLHR